MKSLIYRKIVCAMMTLLVAFSADAAKLDLTAPGVIAALKSTPGYSSRSFSETYNLGPTGLRGWIYIDTSNPVAGQYGLMTATSRQILVTVASPPASAVLAVDDVILGAMAGNSGTVPLFTSDSRKAFAVAIGDAEKTGAGTLRVRRWRAGAITNENIPMTIMGDYTATAPYNCPKSTLILANARVKFISQLLGNPGFLSNSYAGAIKGLALLASVTPSDADYAAVQARLQSYAHSLAAAEWQPNGMYIWDWGYMMIFLSEYYLRTVADGTPDDSVLPGINKYTALLAKAQSRYGTYGHGGSLLKPDGSLHGTIPPYGPVNAAGLTANIAIVLGKKAILAGGGKLDPEIGQAIQRASNFFGFYVNKGCVPYGEHQPDFNGHASNGKDPMSAVLFGLQENRPVEAEYFTRMSVAGWSGRECGHSGQGLSYLWGTMGANVGGAAATAKYLENVRWHLDLVRRTDGSFTYDGQEQFGAGKTADGTYLGDCGYHDMSPTATYLLTYALPLRRLFITGRDAYPANILSADKVTNAIAAATFKLDCTGYNNGQLISALSEYDPLVRYEAAKELGGRPLSSEEVDTLLAMAAGTNTNGRMGACETLGNFKTLAALPILAQRLSDPDFWVRAKAANALKNMGTAASEQLTPILNAFVANATDPEVIVWSDPVQIANGLLSNTIFQALPKNTIGVSKDLLYSVVKAALKQPDSNPRNTAADFALHHLTLEDVQALAPDIFQCVTSESQADTMWSMYPRALAITMLSKYKIAEAMPLALAMQEVPTGFGWGSDSFRLAGMNALSSFGDAARWALPSLRELAIHWKNQTLDSTIASIEAANTSPAGITNLAAVANPQVVATTGAKAITLTGSSCRGTAVSFTNVTAPAHGKLTGKAPNLVYTPAANYRGPDHFTFQTVDSLTTSEPGTVSIIIGVAGTGMKGEYFDTADFTQQKLTRIDPQVDFDWGTGSPDPKIAVDTFSARWNGMLLVPETGTYTFSILNSGCARLYLNGVRLIENHVDKSSSWKDSVTMSLKEGQVVELQMESYQNNGSAAVKLKWTGPSFAGRNGLPISKDWLYDGSNIANRAAYAYSQSVSLIQNTPQVITLLGSGASQPPLIYTLLSQPAHGSLAGAAPNLLYSPVANFSGTDSFTFFVSSGTKKSSAATVSIGIRAGKPVSYFWTNAADGNWSSAANWSDAAGAKAAPTATGQAFYSLNFNKPGTYVTTNDLNNNYSFNQLNVSGTVTFAGTSSLSPTANGPILPQINQNSANTVTFNGPVNLTAMTTISGKQGGVVKFTGLLSGAGGLHKDGSGDVEFPNVTNTYSGGTVINSGLIGLAMQANNALGTGPITLNRGGTLMLNRIFASNPLILNGGTIAAFNGFGNGFSGPVTIHTDSTINSTDILTLSGNITGAGGFTKTGNNPLVLAGTSSFTGPKTINVGTLQCKTAAALGSGALHINGGAKVALNYTGTQTISALTFNAGKALPPGTYGSTASPATNQNDTYFTGTGTVTISPAAAPR